MKKAFFVVLCFVLFGLSFFGMVVGRALQVKSEVVPEPTPSAQPTPTPIEFSLAPPRQSLQGKVMRLTGTVMKTIRSEKDTKETSSESLFLEGEQLIASPSSSIDIQFGVDDLFSVSPETILSFPSTNPNNFLIKIDKGSVLFQTDEKIATISARSLHGLFLLSSGKAQLSVDPDKKIITFMILDGEGKMGYIDTKNMTQTLVLQAGETLIFDDTKRTVRIH
jgi:hypothetical protein